MGHRSYRLITVTVTVFEKVTVTVSVRDYKVAYASFQAGRRPARKLVIYYARVFVNILKLDWYNSQCDPS